MSTLIIVVHLITCFFLILFVLLQAGKGAEVGATFGGISQTFFGTQGGNILTKITTVLAFVFMATSIGLTAFQHKEMTESVMTGVAAPTTQTTPAQTPTTPVPTKAPVAPVKK
ncbi:MAG: preprotein translocase subunit SecG [Proteobacteria bacterium]|nr:preprotein translocase subunit SecG [Pseudomonadota bacterium]